MRFLILYLFLPLVSFGQLQEIYHNNFMPVGSINRSGGTTPNVSLEISITNTDTMYVLRFEDATFQSPVFGKSQPLRETVYFKSVNNSIGQLYVLLRNVFDDKRYMDKNFETTFLLGTRTVVVKRDFYSVKTRIHLLVDGRLCVIKNLKELDNLFAK